MYNRIIKRILDIILFMFVLPFVLIISLIVSPLIYFEDKGTIFYNAMRLGKNGKPFKMYKFRTMIMNAPDIRLDDGSTFNSDNDPRLTKIGRYLRKMSIDELPQIINVIKGDMSFIGPRPDPLDWLDKYSEKERVFLTVKPGISGYNQAYFRNSADGKLKIKNDVFYAEHISFALDCKIIFKTIRTVLFRENLYISKDRR